MPTIRRVQQDEEKEKKEEEWCGAGLNRGRDLATCQITGQGGGGPTSEYHLLPKLKHN